MEKRNRILSLYGDVNGLGKFNKNYGEEKADAALYETLKFIREIEPRNSCVCRVNNGDEFTWIVPNEEASQMQQAFQAITDKLYEKVKKNPELFLSLEFGVADSKSGPFQRVLAAADDELTTKKQLGKTTHSIHFENKWDFLDPTFSKIWTSYLDTRRIFNIKSKDVRSQVSKLSKLFKELVLQSKDSTNCSQVYSGKDIEDSNTPSSEETNPCFSSNLKKCEAIHQFLTENGSADLVEAEDLRNLYDCLCKNRNTGKLSRKYFEKQLLHKLESTRKSYKGEYFVLLAHISGLKESNTFYGHTYTDYSLQQVADVIEDVTGVSYNHETISINTEDNFFIDNDGGEFISLIQEKNFPKNFDPDELLEKIHKRCTNDYFHVLLSYNKTDGSKDIATCLAFAKQDCKEKSENYHLYGSGNKEYLAYLFSDYISEFLKTDPSKEEINKFCTASTVSLKKCLLERNLQKGENREEP